MKVYLASPFFSAYERKRVKKVAEYYRNLNYEVYVPMEHEVANAWNISNQMWGNKVFEADVKAIRECDMVVAILNCGMTDDAGTCWEIGFAYGLNKPIIGVIDNRLQSIMTINAFTEVVAIEDMKPVYDGFIEVK